MLVAEDELTDDAIATRVGIAPRTLYRWKRETEFAAIVGDHIGQIQAGMLKLTIAKKHKRLKVLDDLHDKALRVIEERAAEYAAMAEEDASAPTITPIRSMIGDKSVPAGGGTGLIVRQLKQIGSGRTAQLVEEFAVDIGLLKEIRAQEEQAAKELGQWVEKSETDQRQTIIRIVGVTEDDL